MVVLSYPEEMIGKTISNISTGSEVINISFTDGTFYSIKLEKDFDWNALDHLRKCELYGN